MGIVFSNRADVTEVLDGAATLKPTDTGKVFLLDAAAGATITLPSLAYGLNFRVMVAASFATTNWVVASAEGDNINGTLLVAAAVVAASGEDQINFVASAETVGDYVDFIADKANDQWIVSGVGALSGSITATDPA